MLPRWPHRVIRALAKSRGHNPSQHRKRAEKWIRVPLYTELRAYAIASRGGVPRRRRTGSGPTFSGLFKAILIDTNGMPASFPDDLDYTEHRKLIGDFRIHVGIEWKRRGWVSWSPEVPLSLRVGRSFRELSRARTKSFVASPVLMQVRESP